jgi:cytoskeleton protein RodZ
MGEALRHAREQRGLSVEDVAAQIKLHAKQVEALESENFELLPNITFVRGFVRSYAKLLRLDAAPLLAGLSRTTPEILPTATVDVPFTSRVTSHRRQNMIWLSAAGVIALAAIAFAIWSLNTPFTTDVTVEVPPLSIVREAVSAPEHVVAVNSAAVIPPSQPAVMIASSPAALPVQPVSAVAPQSSLLHLSFDADAWVEIRDRSGKNLSSQLNLSGSQLDLDGRPPFYLVIGNAPTVHLFYKGAAVDLVPHVRPNSSIARLKLE